MLYPVTGDDSVGVLGIGVGCRMSLKSGNSTSPLLESNRLIRLSASSVISVLNR
jgi:hypothetical protein